MVDLAGWQAIDREEKRRGAESGRPRAKITDVEEMRGIAAKSRKPRYSLGRRKER
jgi:ferredoxin--NADP+ reductase